MTLTYQIIFSVTLLIIFGGTAFLILRQKKRKNLPVIIKQKWLNIQRLCANKNTWKQAVVDADKLLEEVLKAKKIRGKSIGERLVAAQRKFSNNDSVWYAHNLSKKIVENNVKRLKESDVKKALIGFRQALRDLGVLNDK